MTGYENHIFVLCLLVFVSLTIVFTAMTVELTSVSVRAIKSGAVDKKIEKDYQKSLRVRKRQSNVQKWITGAISSIVVILFGFAIYVNVAENTLTEKLPVFRVVKTDSMAKCNSENTYLQENNLTNQFSAFDLIVTRKMPSEMDLKLYDIVVYEIDGVLLVHRIVKIEEPNEKHPNSRYFLLQGDAVDSPDRFPVLYEQMKGIYHGEKLPFVGSFILFLQSPAGYMCMALVIFVNLALPLMERKIDKETRKRLVILISIKNQPKYLFQGNPAFWLTPNVFYPSNYFVGNASYAKERVDETDLV